MLSMKTYGVAVMSHEGVKVFVTCHNRATAEFYFKKFASANVLILAPGAGYDADISEQPAVAMWVSQPRMEYGFVDSAVR